jgi:demethylmenaquinone methyltransferase/2-methoxy-6-polyprenyl-1,4-benzoquinol methylase
MKKLAIDASALRRRDRVLVFCCGTGLDFPFVLEKIGDEGTIVGVDFSPEMLEKALDKVRGNGWQNVELVEADVTQLEGRFAREFDAGVCTLGLSIIPDYQAAYRNLCSCVKKHGEVIIGDMQLASGWRALLNPVTVSLSRRFGGTHEGHRNSRELHALMKADLDDVRKREFFFRSYFHCIGKVR